MAFGLVKKLKDAFDNLFGTQPTTLDLNTPAPAAAAPAAEAPAAPKADAPKPN